MRVIDIMTTSNHKITIPLKKIKLIYQISEEITRIYLNHDSYDIKFSFEEFKNRLKDNIYKI